MSVDTHNVPSESSSTFLTVALLNVDGIAWDHDNNG